MVVYLAVMMAVYLAETMADHLVGMLANLVGMSNQTLVYTYMLEKMLDRM